MKNILIILLLACTNNLSAQVLPGFIGAKVKPIEAPGGGGGITAPTFIQEAETVWNTTTSPKATSSFTVQAGDVIVAYAVVENHSASVSISGGSLTWTEQQQVAVTDYTKVFIWTAVASGSTSFAVTFTRSGGAVSYGGNVLTFRGSGGVGASNKTNVSSGAPSLSLTTTVDNSAIVCVSGDWNALNTARTWRTVNSITPSSGSGETSYYADAATYGVHAAYYSDAGTAGAKTVGLTAPAAQKYSIVAIEIKGQ